MWTPWVGLQVAFWEKGLYTRLCGGAGSDPRGSLGGGKTLLGCSVNSICERLGGQGVG